MKTRTARTIALVSSSAVLAGLGLVVLSGSANAVGAPYAGTPIGTLDIRPASGSNQQAIDYTSSGPCPSGASFQTRIFGFGFPDDGQIVTSATSAGFSTTGPINSSFSDTPQAFMDLDETPNDSTDRNETVLTGVYDVVLRCTNRFSNASLGDFRSRITFSSPTAYTATVGPGPVVMSPSPSPTTAPPSPSPTTAPPSPSPTTAPPSPSPTTAPPSPSPTTAPPSPSPTTAPPSPSPTTAPPSQAPTGPPAFCATPATIEINPSTITAGGSADVTVTAPGNTIVDLFAYTRPSTTYRVVRSAELNSSGSTVFTVVPPGNTRLYAQVRGCGVNEPRDSRVLNVRTSLSIEAKRNGPRDYTFSGDSLPARPNGVLTISLFRVTEDGRQILTSRTQANPSDGRWTIDRVFTGSGRFGFVARTGQDLQNAPGSSRIRSTVIF